MSSRYFITDPTGVFINWYSEFLGLETDGQKLVLAGHASVDSVYVGAKTQVDARTLLGGDDNIYLTGNFTDYTQSVSGNEYTFSREIDGFTESVVFVSAFGENDRLCFADGSVNVGFDSLFTNGIFREIIGSELDSGQITPSFPLDSIPTQTATGATRVFITDPTGEVIAAGIKGSVYKVAGHSGIDKIIVGDGTQVDATALLGGRDEIYLSGNFSEYQQSVNGNIYTFSRTVAGDAESVTFAVDFVQSDVVYFADGQVEIEFSTLFTDGVFRQITASEITGEGSPTGGISVTAVTDDHDQSDQAVASDAVTYTLTFSEEATFNSDSAGVHLIDDAGNQIDTSNWIIGTPVQVVGSSSTQWTITITPPTGANAIEDIAVRLQLDANAFSDSNGVPMALPFEQAESTQRFDTLAPTWPTLKLGSDETGAVLNANETSLVVEVGGDDITLGDSIQLVLDSQNLSAPHSVTATDVEAGKVSFTLAKSDLGAEGDKLLQVVVTDLAGNPSLVESADSITITVDETAPVFNSADSVNVSIGMNKAYDANAVDTIGLNDQGVMYSISGADAGLFDIDNTTGILTYKETMTTAAVHNVVITATDAANNESTHAVVINILDAPTLVITDDIDPASTNGNVTFTFAFSESVTGFESADIAVTGGTKSTFSGTGDTYSLIVIPDATSAGNIVVTVADGAATGTDNGNSVTGAAHSQQYDTILPSFPDGARSVTLIENSGAGQAIYTPDASDNIAVVGYELSGDDAALLNINATTGVVTLSADPNYEDKSSYSFSVTAKDAVGNEGVQTVTLTIGDANDAGVLAAISGDATQGQTLTAGTITDEDGTTDGSAIAPTYQWQQASTVDGTYSNISEATSASFELTQEQVGQFIQVVATYTDSQGTQEILTSTATTAVANINDAGALGAISGDATQGQTLTAGTITDVDGTTGGSAIAPTYQWQQASTVDGTYSNISEATNVSFELTQEQVGQFIQVVATYTDSQGTQETLTSTATTAVANINDVGSIAAITGTATEDQTLTAGTITDADGTTGSNTIAPAYQWQIADSVDGTYSNISDATSASFELTQAEVDQFIKVVATYTDGHGTVETVTSTATTAVVNINDVTSVVSPALAISTAQTVTLTAEILGISDPDTDADSIQVTVSSLSHGYITVNESVASSFTLKNLDDGQVTFTHDGSESAPTFAISAVDSDTYQPSIVPVSITFDNTNVENAPVAVAPRVSATEGISVVLSADSLGVTDPDSDDVDVHINVTSVQYGHFAHSTDEQTAISSFTLADVKSSNIVFVHDGSDNTPTAQMSVNNTGKLAGQTLTIAFDYTSVNAAPVILNPSLLVEQAGETPITAADFGISDIDSIDSEVYIHVNNVTNGKFVISGDESQVAQTSLNLSYINAGLFKFIHDGTESPPTFSVGAANSFQDAISSEHIAAIIVFNLADVDDAPVISSAALTISEGQTVVLETDVGKLDIVDADTTPDKVTVKFSDISAGTLTLDVVDAETDELSTSTITEGGTVSLKDIEDGKVKFTHDGSEAVPSFAISAIDQTTTDYPSPVVVNVTFDANIDDAPTLVNPIMIIGEGNSIPILASHLGITDVDSAADKVIISLADVNNGFFSRTSEPTVEIFSFTLEDVTNSTIRFTHDGSDNAPKFSVSVRDENSELMLPIAATVTFNASEDDAPLVIDPKIVVSQNDSVVLTASALGVSDDSVATDVVIIVSDVVNGVFLKATESITQFTLADVNDSLISFKADDTTNSPAFKLAASDSSNTAGTPISAVVSYTSDADDAPLVGAPSLTVNEGQTVIITKSDLAITDVDSEDSALMATVSSVSHGTFVHKDNTTATISEFSLTQVVAEEILFIHDGGEDAPTFSVAASDATTTTPGLPVAANIIFEANVKDAPVVNSATIAINEAQTLVLSSANFDISDVDSPASSLWIKFFDLNHVRIENSDNPGVDITLFSMLQLNDGKISMIHDGGEIAPTFTVSAKDETTPTFAVPVIPTITFVADQDDPPALNKPAFTINEGESITLNVADFKLVDDTSPVLSEITIQVSEVLFGKFVDTTVSSSTAITQFTLANVDAGNIQFIHDGSEAAPSFRLQVKNQSSVYTAAVSAAITFDANVNDAPIVTSPNLTVDEGQTVVLNQSNFGITDDTPDIQVFISITELTGGQFQNLDSNPITYFSIAAVKSGLVQFVHDGGESAPSYKMVVFDGRGGVEISYPVNITFRANINDAVSTASSSLGSLTEGGTITLLASDLNITDDTPSINIWLAPTIQESNHGFFQKITDSNTTPPTTVIITAFTLADVEAGLIQFVHDGSDEAPSITLDIADGSSETPFQAQLTVEFTSIDDAPSLSTTPLITLAQNVATLITVESLGNIVDTDSSANLVSIQVSNVSGGHFEHSGAAETAINSFTLTDVVDGNITFIASGNLAPTFSVAVSNSEPNDDTAVAAIIAFDTSDNDAPIIAPASFDINEGGSIAITAENIGVIDPDNADAEVTITVDPTNGQFMGKSQGGSGPGPFTFTFTGGGKWMGTVPEVSITVSDPLPQTVWVKFVRTSELLQAVQVKIESTEAGFKFTSLDAKYAETGDLNFDFDAGGVAGTLAESDPANGYGLKTVSITGPNGEFESTEFVTSSGIVIEAEYLPIFSTFTLADVASGDITFVTTGTEAPTIRISASDGTNNVDFVDADINFIPSARIIFGDGSGDGGHYGSDGGSAVASDDDTLVGTKQNDIIFGDGSSGGGSGGFWSSSFNGVAGQAGSGSDTINGGDGNDIIFGDGFVGEATANRESGNGGYGGGGAGSGAFQSYGGLSGIGGGNAGFTEYTPAAQTTLGVIRFASDSGALYRYGGRGAGVRGDDSVSVDGTATQISDILTNSLYAKVLNDVMEGDGADTRVFSQTMGDGADTIDGGAGNDYILAGGGDDMITGGQGDDTLHGGAGADTFIYNAGDTGHDTIVGFGLKQGGDVIDLSALLSYDSTGGDDINDYIKVVDDGIGKDLKILIAEDGSGEFFNPVTTITLEDAGIGSFTTDELISQNIFAL